MPRFLMIIFDLEKQPDNFEWQFQKLTEHDFQILMQGLSRNLWDTYRLGELEISNGAMREVLQDSFIPLMQRFFSIKVEEKPEDENINLIYTTRIKD